MKIQDLSVKNKSIAFSGLSFDFSASGIYVISGANGSGKTTVLEKIIFGKDYTVSFSSEEEETLWQKNRCSLFSYVPQDQSNLSVRVRDYLNKTGDAGIAGQIGFWLSEFDLNPDIVNERYQNLSGGEKRKLSIISGLLKNTPYLFLDEPTNDLDNSSVKNLSDILARIAETKTVVLISHDERLSLPFTAEYRLGDGAAEMLTGEKTGERQGASGFGNLRFSLSAVLKLMKNAAFLITAYIALIVIGALLSYSSIYLVNELDDDPYPEENHIYVEGQMWHDPVNDLYIKGEKLQIDETMYGRYISLSDVADVAALDGVKTLYLTDDRYLFSIEQQIYDGTISEKTNILAVPEVYYRVFWENCSVNAGIGLLEGGYPRDGANEIAVSKALLCAKWGYTEESAENAIGDTISVEVNGKTGQYEIVGFTYYDYLLISYREEYCFGVCRYDPAAFDSFAEAKIEFETERHGWVDGIREIVIETEDGKEAAVLDRILQAYPADIVYSHHYSEVWTRQQKADRMKELFVINLIASVLFAGVFLLANRSSAAYNKAVLWDCGNYFVDRIKTQRCYYAFVLLLYIGMTALSIAVNTLLLPHSDLTNLLVLTDAAVMYLPVMLMIVFKKIRIGRDRS